MDATFRVRFITPNGDLGLADLKTTIPFSPTTEIQFYGGPWEEYKEALSVVYDMQDQSLLVQLTPDEIEEENGPIYAELYRANGWSLTGLIDGM